MPTRKLLLHNRFEQIRHELKINNQDIAGEHRRQKFEKMAASPYAFYRGSNHLYWEDFYNDWRISFFGGTAETLTWINGDAHIYNYGAYSNHYGEAIFCMDDFDDAIVADYQFDLWRMAISILLDCRENGVFGEVAEKKALNTFAKSYLKEITSYKPGEADEEVHYTRKTSKKLLKRFLKKVEKKKNRLKMLNKWTVVENGTRRFDLASDRLEALGNEEFKTLSEAFTNYQSSINFEFDDTPKHFQIKDIVRRIKSGTGSLGADRYYILIEGDTDAHDDDVILDVKEQGKPPLYRHMNKSEKNEYDQVYPHEGERHAKATFALAEHPDKYLGWLSLGEKEFSVKERSPYKSDFPTNKLDTADSLCFMAEIWGTILACRHKRASFILNGEAHEMPKKMKELAKGRKKDFCKFVSSVAIQYALRVNQDYDYFLKAVASK